MPYWMRRIFIDILPRVLCMERPQKYDRQETSHRRSTNWNEYIRTTRTFSLQTPQFQLQRTSLLSTQNENENDEQQTEIDVDLFLTREIYEAAEDLSFIANQMRSACEYEEIRDDWKYIASVIDRLQLFIFFAVTTFGTLSILFNAPYILSVIDQHAILKQWDPTFGSTS